MKDIESKFLFLKGIKALDEENTPAALNFFERVARSEPSPLVNSYLAYCIARERGQIKRALSLCEEALGKEPDNAEIYLNLGRIQVLADNKPEAIKAFREGLSRDKNPKIMEELDRLGSRRKPAFSFLPRKNPLNRFIGLILAKLSGKGDKVSL